MSRWKNRAHFEDWSRFILELSAITPDEPIPEGVLLLDPPAHQAPLTEGEREWARKIVSDLTEVEKP